MNITCPNCEKVFNLDASESSQVIAQVRDAELARQVKRHLEIAEKEQGALLEAGLAQMKVQYESRVAAKDIELTQVRGELMLAQTKASAELVTVRSQFELEKTQATANLERELLEQRLAQKAEIDGYAAQLKAREDVIDQLKNLKSSLSTKMVGESLEEHCAAAFNQIRHTAFRDAYFEKDNEVSASGSKGDFVFRDYENGTEILSIMFEMKNEMDTTATKKKNEDFLKELDKDRVEKGCEYAVLVTLLESDSELYNSGIVDMSHRYPKMYVVRPQFFIPIITILRNAAESSAKYRAELEAIKTQAVDLSNFEANLNEFKERFARNYDLASRQFDDAIKAIDNSINQLQKARDALMKSENNLRLANDKSQDITVKRLTKGAESIALLIEGAGA